MKKLILLVIPILLLTGCGSNRECIKSHKERSRCIRAIPNGKGVTTIVVPCNKTVCDEWKEVKE